MEDLQKQLEMLNYKENLYENLIKNNLSDVCNPMKKQEAQAVFPETILAKENLCIEL